MKRKYTDSIEYKLRIKAIRSNVVLRKELKDLGSYRQVSRALNKLIEMKKIVSAWSLIQNSRLCHLRPPYSNLRAYNSNLLRSLSYYCC